MVWVHLMKRMTSTTDTRIETLKRSVSDLAAAVENVAAVMMSAIPTAEMIRCRDETASVARSVKARIWEIASDPPTIRVSADAHHGAVRACIRLIQAYNRGHDRHGIDWSDVDDAHAMALSAMKQDPVTAADPVVQRSDAIAVASLKS